MENFYGKNSSKFAKTLAIILIIISSLFFLISLLNTDNWLIKIENRLYDTSSPRYEQASIETEISWIKLGYIFAITLFGLTLSSFLLLTDSILNNIKRPNETKEKVNE